MSNVISFEDAKKRRLEKITNSQIVPDVNVLQRETTSSVDVSFRKDVKSFRFIGMPQPGAFVQIDLTKMPPYFPPDPPPPMAA